MPTNGTTDVVVTVLDQNGNPISGAHVVGQLETGGTTPGDTDPGVGTALDGYTDGNGQVTFADASAGTHTYYVDTTNDANFNDGVDYATQVTVGSFSPEPTTLNFTSQDGTTFDLDEYATGDTRVRLLDQNGNPVANQFVFYSFHYTPFRPAVGTDEAQTFTGQAHDGLAALREHSLPADAKSQGGNTAAV